MQSTMSTTTINGGTDDDNGLTILPGCSKVIFSSVQGRATQPQKKTRRRAGSKRGTWGRQV